MSASASIDPLAWPCVAVTGLQVGLSAPAARPLELVGPLPGRPRLAIVGSRAAHQRVLRTIGPMVEAAGRRGWSLLSGGALGIDGAMHRAALERGLCQLAVLPCGRDRLYPPGHARMFSALVDSGSAGLLFAHPQGTQSVRAMFYSRNATVIALADAVIVAEAGLRSGSRGTGELALRRGLPIAALAGTPGCGALIGAGARALLRPGHDDDPELVGACVGAWLDELSGAEPSGPQASTPSWPEHLAWLERWLATAGPAGANIDTLADPTRAAVALCEAELLGLVCEGAAGRWLAIVRRE